MKGDGESVEQGDGGGGGASAPPPPFPCLNSINSDKAKDRNARGARSAYLCRQTIEALTGKADLNRLGFLTLTFSDEVRLPKEASRRFDNFRRRVLKWIAREDGWLKVFERHESGRIH